MVTHSNGVKPALMFQSATQRFPPLTSLSPCAHIEYIETMCWPLGGDPIHFDGHAQCMCKGSFFAEWHACQKCLYIHGYRSERESSFYNNVLSSASEQLCTGTPTAPFRSLFAQIESSAARVTTGATVKSDLYPGNSDIGLYYTASGPQGLGKVTGDAATLSMAGGLATAGPITSVPTEPTPATGQRQGGATGSVPQSGRAAIASSVGLVSLIAVSMTTLAAAVFL
ncbi:unnamed protein product [Parascedosporium putredinis]|uniref:Uncharacterized protein n=1 Tax=Parascedosporium putredinis TaxID=1442378 RepID=A0A9P1H401_9PEZI|nr:unnamed protein product [Parascedosporium putredinis]CAI7995581.1 unnamed protein product [Parascedosporium putredinis]